MSFTLEQAAEFEVPLGRELNPNLRGPVAVWYAPEWLRTRGIAENALLTGTSPPTRVLTEKGWAASFNNATGRIRIAADADILFPDSTQATIAIWRRSRDTTGRNSSIFGYNAASAERVGIHAPHGDGNFYFDFGNATAGSGRLSVAFTKIVQWETIICVAGGGKGREIWRNATRIASNTSANASRTSTSAAVHIGSKDGTDNSDTDDIALVVVSRYAWSDGEIKAWSRNPFAATFAPQKIWVPVSAGGSQTIALGQVAETDTAQALTAAQLRAIGQCAETETAQALTSLLATAIGQATETGLAQSVANLALTPK